MTSRAFLFCAFALLAACSQSDVTDDADSSDSDLKIKPTGGSSAIKVSVPAGATGRVMARRQEGGTTVELTPGTAKPVAPGKYCIYTRITSATNQYDVQFEFSPPYIASGPEDSRAPQSTCVKTMYIYYSPSSGS